MKQAPVAAHLLRGAAAEQTAYDFLIAQGLTPVCRNFHCRYGELDLVMTEAEMLVIVEVRYRRSEKFGGAIASITAKKKSKMIAAAQYYLATYQVKSAVRFDVIAISEQTGLQWIKNAFQT